MFVTFNAVVVAVSIGVALTYLVTLSRHRSDLGPGPVAKRFPFLVLLIPAYNEEKNVAAAITSVLQTSYPEERLRVIVINDGSRDRTSEIARRFAERGVEVIDQKNRGKASALNTGLRRALAYKPEMIATLDADSVVEPDSIVRMVAYLEDPQVMAVIPTIRILRHETVVERLQRSEYLVMGLMRKAASFLNAITVTPGPLSVFKARVFEELGLFDEGNITEDEEMALRIQSAHYRIAYALDAIVKTLPPRGLSALFRQRLRWYRGHLRNVWAYRRLFHPRYRWLGLFVLPAGLFVNLSTVALVCFNMGWILSRPQALAAMPMLGVGGLLGLWMIALFISLVLLALSVRFARDGRWPSFLGLYAYLLGLWMLVPFFWGASVACELAGVDIAWRRRQTDDGDLV